jgi:predicted metalloprotease
MDQKTVIYIALGVALTVIVVGLLFGVTQAIVAGAGAAIVGSAGAKKYEEAKKKQAEAALSEEASKLSETELEEIEARLEAAIAASASEVRNMTPEGKLALWKKLNGKES